jgi:hypothetical protein
MLACASSTPALTRDTQARPWGTERRRQLSPVGERERDRATAFPRRRALASGRQQKSRDVGGPPPIGRQVLAVVVDVLSQ